MASKLSRPKVPAEPAWAGSAETMAKALAGEDVSELAVAAAKAVDPTGVPATHHDPEEDAGLAEARAQVASIRKRKKTSAAPTLDLDTEDDTQVVADVRSAHYERKGNESPAAASASHHEPEADDSDATADEGAALDSILDRLRNARIPSRPTDLGIDDDDDDESQDFGTQSEPASTAASAGDKYDAVGDSDSSPLSDSEPQAEQSPSAAAPGTEMSERSSGKPPEPEWVLEMRQLASQAQKGDTSALLRLRRFLDGKPEVWQYVGNLAELVERAWITAIASEDGLAAECMKRKTAEMRAELAGANPDQLERMLVDQIIACWLQLQYCMATAADLTSEARLCRAYLARQESAQRCFDRAVGLHSTARRLNGAGLTPRPDAATAHERAALQELGKAKQKPKQPVHPRTVASLLRKGCVLPAGVQDRV